MREDREGRLVKLLQGSNEWLSAASLAGALGVSERTVRNYVTRLSRRGVEIEASRAGYRLQGALEAPMAEAPRAAQETVEGRAEAAVLKLLATEGPVSLFDLADELLLSESTVGNSVLPRVREMLAPYGMRLEAHDYMLSLVGAESDKRRLLGSFASRDGGPFFTTEQALDLMFPSVEVNAVLQGLAETCRASGLPLSDYALNNLLVHMLVIMERLASGHRLEDADDPVDPKALIASMRRREDVLKGADAIATMLQVHFGVQIPERDFRQITLLLALSIDLGEGGEDLVQLMDPDFLQVVSQIVSLTAERYGLEPFDEDFCVHMTLHMFNAYQRSMLGISCPNPIAANLKRDHMPVYDMAVFFAHRFSQLFHVNLSDDEVGFIAFHLGAYLERTKEEHPPITCVVVADRYLGMAERLLASLEDQFHNRLVVTRVCSASDYATAGLVADLVINASGAPVAGAIEVSPLLTRHDIHRVRRAIDHVEEERGAARGRAYLKGLLSQNLYVRDLAGLSQEAVIKRLGALVQHEGLASSDFIDDVLLRERFSSTAFTDQLAVPHAMEVFAERSFVAVAHSERPIPWGRHDVNFVLLIGLAKEERGRFQEAMGVLVDAFSDVDATMKLLATRDFDGFVAALCG